MERKPLTVEEIEMFRTEMLLHLGRENAKRGVVMQLHYGVQRNTNTKKFQTIGADTGFDTIAGGGDAAVCLLLFSLSVRLFFPSGAETLRSFLLPGKFSVTQTAVESFMGDIRSGEPLGQSFTAFCTYIIDHDETFFS